MELEESLLNESHCDPRIIQPHKHFFGFFLKGWGSQTPRVGGRLTPQNNILAVFQAVSGAQNGPKHPQNTPGGPCVLSRRIRDFNRLKSRMLRLMRWSADFLKKRVFWGGRGGGIWNKARTWKWGLKHSVEPPKNPYSANILRLEFRTLCHDPTPIWKIGGFGVERRRIQRNARTWTRRLKHAINPPRTPYRAKMLRLEFRPSGVARRQGALVLIAL